MEESFKYILPSNASAAYYPKNTASDFQIHLNNPLYLTGEWQVGIESMYYSSNIGDKEEEATIELTCKSKKTVFVNDLYPFKFKVTADNKWRGYEGLFPKTITENGTDWQNVLKSLNSLNEEMLVGKKQLFTFRIVNHRFFFESEYSGFHLQISKKLSNYFEYATHKIPADFKFTKDDYKIYLLHESVVEKDKRIILKNIDEFVIATESSIKRLWEERVKKHYNISIDFKDRKLILHNSEDGVAIVCSNHLSARIKLEGVLRKGLYKVASELENKTRTTDEFWYIDVYKNNLATTTTDEITQLPYTFKPRYFSSIKDIGESLNKYFPCKLLDLLKASYNAVNHKWEVKIENNRLKLTLGKWIHMQWSKNLSFMFGLDKTNFEGGRHYDSIKPIGILKDLETYLFISTNIIEAVLYGEEKLQIIQDFVHNSNQKGLVEKSFFPIVFYPLKSNCIRDIRLQILNEVREPVKMKDAKSIVILHFRKIE